MQVDNDNQSEPLQTLALALFYLMIDFPKWSMLMGAQIEAQNR